MLQICWEPNNHVGGDGVNGNEDCEEAARYLQEMS